LIATLRVDHAYTMIELTRFGRQYRINITSAIIGTTGGR
jgi:hypothetical protein